MKCQCRPLDKDFLDSIKTAQHTWRKFLQHYEHMEDQGISLKALEEILGEYRPLAEEIEFEKRQLLGIAVDLGG